MGWDLILDQLKCLPQSTKSAYPLFKPSCHLLPPILAEFDMDSHLLFPYPQIIVIVAQKIDEGAMEFSRRPLGVLSVRSPQSTVPEKNGAQGEV